MLGCRYGCQTFARQAYPDIIRAQSSIHRQAIIMKTVPDELSNVLGEVIGAVILIAQNKTCTQNSLMCAIFYLRHLWWTYFNLRIPLIWHSKVDKLQYTIVMKSRQLSN